MMKQFPDGIIYGKRLVDLPQQLGWSNQVSSKTSDIRGGTVECTLPVTWHFLLPVLITNGTILRVQITPCPESRENSTITSAW